MNRKATLDEIALEADVSAATVSRTFNKPQMVSGVTREKVFEASRRLGMGVPALQTLGLIVPDASNPFFSQLIYLFERELAVHGAQLVSASADGRPDREVEIVERFRAMGVEGIFYTPARSGGEAILELVSRGDVPVLAFDRQIVTGNLDCVTTSSRTATQTMVDYLVNLEHERFGYILGADQTTTASDRYEAFVHALARNSLELRPSLTFPGNYHASSGRDAAESFLLLSDSERPTVMVAANDLMAIGFIQRVQQEGLSVPLDVSVTGFDGIEFGAWYSPSLTTVVQPVRRLVREATKLLLDRISRTSRGDELPRPRTVTVDPRFVVRDSVGVPRSSRRPPGLYVLNNESDN
ncbi:LacI family DNA-binding transcriptional regulator [Nocardia sp. MW-W600-9]